VSCDMSRVGFGFLRTCYRNILRQIQPSPSLVLERLK
jgi:hypothetical protein